MDLIIPHKEINLRRFVLEPLYEVAPFKIHPVFGKTVAELFSELMAQIREKENKEKKEKQG